MIPQTTDATEQRRQAKAKYLNDQKNVIVERLRLSDERERAATVRHINSFLPVTLPEQAKFWQSVKADILAIDEVA